LEREICFYKHYSGSVFVDFLLFLKIDFQMKSTCFHFLLLVFFLFFEKKATAIDISGAAVGCPNGMKTYEITPIAGAISYKWTATNGAKINGFASPATLDSTGFSVQIIFPGTPGNIFLKVTATLNGGGSVVSNQKLVSVQPLLMTNLPPEIRCFEDFPITLCGKTITSSGFIDCKFTSVAGCDSLVRHTFLQKPYLSHFIGVKYLCEGDSFPVGNQFAKIQGPNQFLLQSIEGCDSFINVTIILLPKAKIVGANEFCGDSTILLKSGISGNNTSFPTISRFWMNQLGDTLSLSDSLLITETGKYFFQLTRKFATQNIFCTSTDSIEVNNCSVQTVNFSEKINPEIYPNPAKNGQFFIQNESNLPFFVKIVRPDGRLIYAKKIEKPLESVEISENVTGLFFIIFENLDGQFLSSKKLFFE
jgi:hypothetical protein